MKQPLIDDINPRLWYGITQAARLIGISPKTLSVKASIAPSLGGIEFRLNPSNGRREFKGEEMLRFIFREPPKPWRKYQKLSAKK